MTYKSFYSEVEATKSLFLLIKYFNHIESNL